jgi:non-homologous end joining protein Ku
MTTSPKKSDEVPTAAVDLMAALKASLEKARLRREAWQAQRDRKQVEGER